MARRERRARPRGVVLRRVRAILAGGIVLGVGAASTLAAWTDQEHVTATIGAGTFGIVGSADGTSFTEHASSSTAAALDFSVAASRLVPGQTVYAGFSVRTLSTSVAGVAGLSADSGNGAGLGTHLRYGARTITGAVCNATTFAAGTEVVPTGSAMTVSSTTSQQLAASAGSTVRYCFAVTLPASAGNEAQGLTSTPRWVVAAQAS
ncbi:SipW-dependent-type signal peptide-containing protein [Microbacterium halophytorum]|uniref:SipW-dependent-type signal peptide-containing protein n=1 Tax=Microbacterium halophytorum TaxID=2067568 RepID=UPI000CFE1849|nr:SipW-dependent-type signal peptide-containing protein [Microbacterium halophytorum]